jgi:hypothetical protein
MPSYRIYVLDATDHIREPPAKSDDDLTAIEKAKQLLDGKVIEIWERDRQITRLAPVQPKATISPKKRQ